LDCSPGCVAQAALEDWQQRGLAELCRNHLESPPGAGEAES